MATIFYDLRTEFYPCLEDHPTDEGGSHFHHEESAPKTEGKKGRANVGLFLTIEIPLPDHGVRGPFDTRAPFVRCSQQTSRRR